MSDENSSQLEFYYWMGFNHAFTGSPAQSVHPGYTEQAEYLKAYKEGKEHRQRAEAVLAHDLPESVGSEFGIGRLVKRLIDSRYGELEKKRDGN